MQRLCRWLAAASFAAGVLCLVPGVSAQQKGGPLIVPGKSVGEIPLGTKPSEVVQKLGPAAVSESAAGRGWMGWFGSKEGGGRGPELDAAILSTTGDAKDRYVAAIRLESAFFHTKEEISTQSSLADIWKVFPELRYSHADGEDAAVEQYADKVHGIAIEVRRTKTDSNSLTAPGGAWGVCQAIIVFEPGSEPTIRSMRNMPAD